MSGAQVLIVDDNALNLKLLSFLLVSHGYEVRTATNATDAQLALGETLPHIILMDVCMPGVDGLTLVRLLKADPRTRDIPVVAVTAAAMKGDAEIARAAGCDDYITKPIDTRAFPGRLADLLKR